MNFFEILPKSRFLNVLSNIFWVQIDRTERWAGNKLTTQMDPAELPDRMSFIVDLHPNASSYDHEPKTEFIELFKGYQSVCRSKPLQSVKSPKI